MVWRYRRVDIYGHKSSCTVHEQRSQKSFEVSFLSLSLSECFFVMEMQSNWRRWSMRFIPYGETMVKNWNIKSQHRGFYGISKESLWHIHSNMCHFLCFSSEYCWGKRFSTPFFTISLRPTSLLDVVENGTGSNFLAYDEMLFTNTKIVHPVAKHTIANAEVEKTKKVVVNYYRNIFCCCRCCFVTALT